MKLLDVDLTPEQYREAELDEHVRIVKRSLDSRRGVRYHTTMEVYQPGETVPQQDYHSNYKDCRNAAPVVIIGAGPAGLFAALRALELGLKPIIIERGKAVSDRKYDIAKLTKEHKVNPDSNWCFGEGGAGTYSDGKLYTRSTKRGDVSAVLKKFIEHGADEKILIDAHAHIGTDRLSPIIAKMRETVESHGGEYHFDTRITDLIVNDGVVKGTIDSKGTRYEGEAVILATGHSARDIYHLFHQKGWLIEPKPFALGVRVEHPQELINTIQYHSHNYSPLLPPAAYSLTTQVDGHGMFSFCMCPGGIIVPATTASGFQVVNGMSNSKRNSPFANSGIAVTVSVDDVPEYVQYGDFALLKFQEEVERAMYAATGVNTTAPMQTLTDFCEGKTSNRLNKTNYMGSVTSAPLHQLLPPFVANCLRQGFKDFDRKMRGFYTSEASLLAVESRTSSPIRIPRGDDYQHPQLRKLYPCGEGAGYAGGIVSSAMDGINAMDKIVEHINDKPHTKHQHPWTLN